MPLDPAYPPARLAGMLEDAGARVVLSAGTQRAGLLAGEGETYPTAPSTWCAWTTPWKPWRSPPARIPLPGSGGPRGPGLRRLHLRLHRAPQGGGRHPPGDQPPGLQHGLHHPDARRPDGPRLEPLLRRGRPSSCGGPSSTGPAWWSSTPPPPFPGPGGPHPAGSRSGSWFLTTALFNQLAATAPDAFATMRHLSFWGGRPAPPRRCSARAPGRPCSTSTAPPSAPPSPPGTSWKSPRRRRTISHRAPHRQHRGLRPGRPPAACPRPASPASCTWGATAGAGLPGAPRTHCRRFVPHPLRGPPGPASTAPATASAGG